MSNGAASSIFRIGVARDAAFQFYSAENLDLLRPAGADLASGVQCPLFCRYTHHFGGYPELHAAALGANVAVRKRCASAGRKPIYAECGGLMYLAEALEDLDGVAHPMVGLLPTTVRMRPRRLSLGYTEVVFAANAPLGGAGTIARGHEFHYSSMDPVPDSIARVYQIRPARGEARSEGYLINRTLMSYVHLHFASNPALAQSFVDACAGSARPGKR
jgi:cobyrinic acid a,c-diamide synthase